MASSTLLLLNLTIILCFASYLHPTISTTVLPCLSPSTLSTDYQKMHSTFKVFAYALPPLNLTTRSSSSSSAALFHSSLLSSRFITTNPADAHLFYLPFPPDLPARSLDRLISRLRSSSPFWNRSLAADHFFLSSCTSAAPSSSRNVVELRKNAVRLTDCFSGHWVPHKDVSLPPSPLNRTSSLIRTAHNYKYLGFLKTRGSASVRGGAALMDGLKADPEFLIESQPLNTNEWLGTTRFCLFWYGGKGEVTGLGEALAYGCVPVVITDDRPIQDMPLMDVLRWQEMALFVGTGVGPVGLKRILNDVAAGDKYERMTGLGEAAAQHFAWNDPPKPYDAFHMVMYQLWLRRHAVGYGTWEMR